MEINDLLLRDDFNDVERVQRQQQENTQVDVKKEIIEKASTGEYNLQKQLLQLLASTLPQQQQEVQKTAQDQINQGFLDIKV